MINNPYAALTQEAASRYGIDPLLLTCQIQQESQFRPDAVSECGAVGLLQVMPATGAGYGYSAFELRNPATNLDVGARYLREQYDHFPEVPLLIERWKFALAAYNCGRGYVNKALALNREARRRLPPVWWCVSGWLMHPDSKVNGKQADAVQVIDYVWQIWTSYEAEVREMRQIKAKDFNV